MYQAEVEEDIDDAKPNKCKVCLYYTWKLFTCIFSHIFLVSLVIAYCYLGAIIFESLESDNEKKVKSEIPQIRENIVNHLWNLNQNSAVLDEDNWTNDAITTLKMFEANLLTTMKVKGWDGTEGNKTTQWTFAGALFYSIIVITTIGYGHIAPKTPWGKVVTIFYAILGIPLMLLCLSNIGDVMAHSFRFLYWRVCCYMCTRKPKRQPSKRFRSNRGTIRSSSSGRTNWSKSRGQSFKHPPVRTSTKSADSALGLSETAIVRSSSDTECRYEEKDISVDISHLRSSQNSGYSDTIVSTGKPGNPYGRGNSHFIRSKSHIESTEDRQRMDNSEAPVLFNKYALDRDESMKGKYSTRSLPRQKTRNYHLNPQYQSSPYAGSLRRQHEFDQHHAQPLKSSRKITGSSPRIMSPMGFAVPRQPSYRSSKSTKYRADTDYEDDYEFYDDYQDQSAKIKPVPIWLCVFLVISYIIGGAFLFQMWENWNLFDSAYFCFITLTTIGFGDFVPASQRVKGDAGYTTSIALCSLYLLFGIALLAMSFNLVQEEVINNVKSIAKRLGILKDEGEDE